jgi:hypothetical protein
MDFRERGSIPVSQTPLSLIRMTPLSQFGRSGRRSKSSMKNDAACKISRLGETISCKEAQCIYPIKS